MNPSTLDLLTAKAAIGDMLARYCRAIDRMDRELALSVWHDDGTCNYEGFFEGDAAGFVDTVWEAHSHLFRHSHRIANSLIEVDGDRAASETYVTATLWGHPSDDGVLEVISTGRYLDQWSLRDGRWAINHRIEVSDLTTMRTVPPGGWSRAGELSARDPSDPSYRLFGGIGARPDR